MDGGIEIILSELIEMMQATAPVLWAIAQRQVLARLATSVLWGTALLFTSILLGRAASRDKSDDQGVSILLTAIALILALYCLGNVFHFAISPDYYAIKVLLELVR